MQLGMKEASKWLELAAGHGNGPAAKALAQILGGWHSWEGGPTCRIFVVCRDSGRLKDALREAAKLRDRMTKKEWETVQNQLRHRAIGPKKLDAALQQAVNQ